MIPEKVDEDKFTEVNGFATPPRPVVKGLAAGAAAVAVVAAGAPNP